jgi:hypothetical protein
MTVTPGGVAPIINPIDDHAAVAPSAYTSPTPSLAQGTQPVTWSIVQAPSGVVIDTNTGVVSRDSTAVGTYNFTIRATNQYGSDDESWDLIVDSGVVAPVIDEIPDATAMQGTTYHGPFPTLSQGTLPVTWQIVAGPSGLLIDSQNGKVTWPNPNPNGSPHTVTLRATNSAGIDDETWLITVNPTLTAPLIANVPDASVSAGNTYTGPTPSLIEGSLPVTWSLDTGPSGMTINAETGVVRWTNTTTVGSPHTVVIRATNSVGNDTEIWAVTVTPLAQPPIIAAIDDGATDEGSSYTGPTPVLTQGLQPVQWLLLESPAGMTIDGNTGVVQWNEPTADGSPHLIHIRAQNSAGSDDESWMLTVNIPLPDMEATITLAAMVTEPAFGDGGTVEYIYDWYDGTQLVASHGPTTALIDVLQMGNLNRAKRYTCLITPVVNSNPVGTLPLESGLIGGGGVGDINDDGAVNSADVTSLVNRINLGLDE